MTPKVLVTIPITEIKAENKNKSKLDDYMFTPQNSKKSNINPQSQSQVIIPDNSGNTFGHRHVTNGIRSLDARSRRLDVWKLHVSTDDHPTRHWPDGTGSRRRSQPLGGGSVPPAQIRGLIVRELFHLFNLLLLL